MNYPVWERAFAGGGLLVVVIAVIHVYIAHFAVGGGFFLVLTEWMGYRKNRPEVTGYVKSHAFFFLLVTMVLGATTGVGIWFTISLVSPGATSILIHEFVFAWATEWLFFAAEIVCLFVYWYRFDHMSRRDHLVVGGFYVLFAWLSLFMVNGVIAVMLTPGRWVKTGGFWDGFFNPSMWPSLGYRTCIALMFAGIFGFITTVFSKNRRRLGSMVRWCTLWTVGAFILSGPFLIWYFEVLPPERQAMILSHSPELRDAALFFGVSLALIFTGIGMLKVIARGRFRQVAAVLVLLAGLAYMGGFEWLREGARRPYLIVGHTWASGISVDQAAIVADTGMLATARWIDPQSIASPAPETAGKALFRLECASCHAIGGPANDILPLTQGYTVAGMDAQLSGQGRHSAYMPPFMGSPAERRLLARYLVEVLHGRTAPTQAVAITSEETVIPSFDADADEYVLLASSSLGMHEFSSTPEIWSLRGTPRASIRAQLIRRGETPEPITEEVSVILQVPRGQGIAAPMSFSGELLAWSADITALSPLDRNGRYRPYPLIKVTASRRGKRMASTRITLPQATEWGCADCHGGRQTPTGVEFDRQTARQVLAAHDRRSRTDLLKTADSGTSVVCTDCHKNGTTDPGSPLNLSAAIHGFHAVYLASREEDACSSCHATRKTGATRFYRGVHNEIGLACSNCHGDINTMALELLNAVSERDKPAARRIRPWLKTSASPDSGRQPWVNLPDCLGCHVDFTAPDTDMLPVGATIHRQSDRFSSMTDDAGILCTSCHGSPHALYPSANPYGIDRDNLPAMQHQGSPYPVGANGGCRVCHTIEMTESVHHFDASAQFRNAR